MTINEKKENRNHIAALLSWLAISISFLLGISFAHTNQWAAVAAFCVITLLSLPYSTRYQTLILCTAFIVGGARLKQQKLNHSLISLPLQHNALDIVGVVSNIEYIQHDLYTFNILINVIETKNIHNEQSQSNHFRLQCYTKKTPLYTIGDTIKINSIKIAKPNNLSFENYLIKEGIHATAFLQNNKIQVIHRPLYNIKRSIHTFMNNILINLKNNMSCSSFLLFSSIFLGNRSCIKKQYQQVKRIFLNWGIIHYLARSGMHLIIFIMLLHLLLRLIAIHLIYKQFLTILLTGIYIILTWSSISFLRACAAFLWYTACNMAGLQINATYIILALSNIFLLLNPMLLFFLDFQLSFGLTLVLTIINNPNLKP